MKKRLFILLLSTSFAATGQILKPNMQALNDWIPVNRSVEVINENNLKGVKLSEADGEGLLLLKDKTFQSGAIEFDVKGKNVLQKSFVGVAFHIQDDKTYDAIYFRPFNFLNTDTVRRWRSVQYISAPDYPWEKLRADSPGKYENKVTPVPDPESWFHVKILVEGKSIKVFVNNSTKSSLEVTKLTAAQNGGIGLWVGNGSGGSFANLFVVNKR